MTAEDRIASAWRKILYALVIAVVLVVALAVKAFAQHAGHPPEHQAIHFQSLRNKQGRREDDVPADLREKVLEILTSSQEKLYGEYEQLLESDIARELARINLPLSLYTEWYWKIDLHNLFHFLRLRIDPHAQYEIRVYGEAMAEITQKVAPMAWEAFEDYILKRFVREYFN